MIVNKNKNMQDELKCKIEVTEEFIDGVSQGKKYQLKVYQGTGNFKYYSYKCSLTIEEVESLKKFLANWKQDDKEKN